MSLPAAADNPVFRKRLISHPFLGDLHRSGGMLTGEKNFEPLGISICVYLNASDGAVEPMQQAWQGLSLRHHDIQRETLELAKTQLDDDGGRTVTSVDIEAVQFEADGSLVIHWGVTMNNEPEAEYDLATKLDGSTLSFYGIAH